MNITYSEFMFVAFVIQHVKLLHHAILSSLYGIFPHYLKKNVFKKKLLNIKYMF